MPGSESTDTVVYVVGLGVVIIGVVATAIGAVATGRAAAKEAEGSDARGSLRFAQIILWAMFGLLLLIAILILVVLGMRARRKLPAGIAELQQRLEQASR